jgi:hypothetical protein
MWSKNPRAVADQKARTFREMEAAVHLHVPVVLLPLRRRPSEHFVQLVKDILNEKLASNSVSFFFFLKFARPPVDFLFTGSSSF